MSSRRYARGWGALSLAAGAVLAATAAPSPAGPDAVAGADRDVPAASAPDSAPPAVVSVDGCA
ncbi:hypothetical protein ACWDNT_32715, partial [Streptomyces sp. NPDC000963]